MNKKLLNQIRNEWRSNVWLTIELLFVSVLMWLLVDYIFSAISNYIKPLGFNVEHCYNLQCSSTSSSAPNYIAGDTVPFLHMEEIASRLRKLPEIETVSISNYAVPYSPSNSWGSLKCDTTHFGKGSILHRHVDSNFFIVFRYQGANGESPEKLAQIFDSDKNGILAASDIKSKDKKLKITSRVGKMFTSDDTTKTYRLLALYKPVRYADFETPAYARSFTTHLTPDDYAQYASISVRVKPECDKDFKNRLWKYADTNLRVGNLYVSTVKSFVELRDTYNHQNLIQIRKYLFFSTFLLLNIFLGLLGTFWFRTQSRRSEIALFKVMGATNRSVFGRQMAEGMLILTLTTIFAVIIDWQLAEAGVSLWIKGIKFNGAQFAATTFITYLIIALVIFLGNLMPARKAMKIQPAEALHDE